MTHTRKPRFTAAPERILALLGLLLIGWYCVSVATTRAYQANTAEWFESLRLGRPAGPPRGTVVGRLDIPAVGVTAMVAEGTDAKTLRRAVGHWTRSPLPGRRGRSVLAGHRDTFFKHLERVRPGDRIMFETPAGDMAYRVRDTAVIGPKDLAALEIGAASGLTLITCYPFHFVGPAPLRYIVRADRVDDPPHAIGG